MTTDALIGAPPPWRRRSQRSWKATRAQVATSFRYQALTAAPTKAPISGSAASATQIEILRGPASLAYGSGASGGALKTAPSRNGTGNFGDQSVLRAVFVAGKAQIKTTTVRITQGIQARKITAPDGRAA